VRHGFDLGRKSQAVGAECLRRQDGLFLLANDCVGSGFAFLGFVRRGGDELGLFCKLVVEVGHVFAVLAGSEEDRC
jgi:hypothetical protein